MPYRKTIIIVLGPMPGNVLGCPTARSAVSGGAVGFGLGSRCYVSVVVFGVGKVFRFSQSTLRGYSALRQMMPARLPDIPDPGLQ